MVGRRFLGGHERLLQGTIYYKIFLLALSILRDGISLNVRSLVLSREYSDIFY